MPVHFNQVFSGTVDQIGYDDASGELHVIWKTGKESIYSGVPPALANQTTNAASIGQELNSSIKNKFPHRYGGG